MQTFSRRGPPRIVSWYLLTSCTTKCWAHPKYKNIAAIYPQLGSKHRFSYVTGLCNHSLRLHRQQNLLFLWKLKANSWLQMAAILWQAGPHNTAILWHTQYPKLPTGPQHWGSLIYLLLYIQNLKLHEMNKSEVYIPIVVAALKIPSYLLRDYR